MTSKSAFVKQKLQEAGYQRLPPLWLPSNEAAQVVAFANRHRDDVRQIYEQASNEHAKTVPDPVRDKDAAWAAFEKQTQHQRME